MNKIQRRTGEAIGKALVLPVLNDDLQSSDCVDIFKTQNLINKKNFSSTGYVDIVLSPVFKKLCLVALGSTSSANRFRIPQQQTKNFLMTHKYVYIQLSSIFSDIISRQPINQFEDHHTCSISFNVLTRGMTPFRIMLTTLVNTPKLQATQVQLPLNLNKFSTICLDLPDIVQRCCPSTIYIGCNQIEGVSNIALKGIYFSDQKYTPISVPEIMQIPLPINKSQNEDNIDVPLIQCYDWFEINGQLEFKQIFEEQFKEQIMILRRMREEQQIKLQQKQEQHQKKIIEFQNKYKNTAFSTQKQVAQKTIQIEKDEEAEKLKQQKQEEIKKQEEQKEEQRKQQNIARQIAKKQKKNNKSLEFYKNIDQTFEFQQSINQRQILKIKDILGCNQQYFYNNAEIFEQTPFEMHDYDSEDQDTVCRQVCKHVNNYMKQNLISYQNGKYLLNKLQKHSMDILNLYGDVYALLLNNKYFVTIYTEKKQVNITINTIKIQIEQQLQKCYDKTLYELSSYIQNPLVQHINTTSTQILIVFQDVIALFRYKIIQDKIQFKLQHIMYTDSIKVGKIDSSIICNDNKIILAGSSKKGKQTFWCLNMKVENLQQAIKDKLQDIQLFEEAIILETQQTHKYCYWKIQPIRNNQFIAINDYTLMLLQYSQHKLECKQIEIDIQNSEQQIEQELTTRLLKKCPQCTTQLFKDEISKVSQFIVKQNKFIDINVIEDRSSRNKLDQLVCIANNSCAFMIISTQKLLNNDTVQANVLLDECRLIIQAKPTNNGKLILADIGGRIMQFDMYNDFAQLSEAINFQNKMLEVKILETDVNQKAQSSFIFSQSDSNYSKQPDEDDCLQIQSIQAIGDVGITTIQGNTCKYQRMFQFVGEPIMDFQPDPSDPQFISIACPNAVSIFKNGKRYIMLKATNSRRILCYSQYKYILAIYNIDLNTMDVIDLDNEDNAFASNNVFDNYQQQGNNIETNIFFTKDGKYLVLSNNQYGANIYEIQPNGILLIKKLTNIKQIYESEIKCGQIYSILYCIDNENRVKYALTNELLETNEWKIIRHKDNNNGMQIKILPSQSIQNYLYVIKLIKEEMKTQFLYKIIIETYDVLINKQIEQIEILVGGSQFDENPNIHVKESLKYGTLLIGVNLQVKCFLLNYNGKQSQTQLRKQILPFEIDKMEIDLNEDIQILPHKCQSLMKFTWNVTDKCENEYQEQEQILKLQQKIIEKKMSLLSSSSSFTQWSLKHSSRNQ